MSEQFKKAFKAIDAAPSIIKHLRVIHVDLPFWYIPQYGKFIDVEKFIMLPEEDKKRHRSIKRLNRDPMTAYIRKTAQGYTMGVQQVIKVKLSDNINFGKTNEFHVKVLGNNKGFRISKILTAKDYSAEGLYKAAISLSKEVTTKILLYSVMDLEEIATRSPLVDQIGISKI